MGRFNKITSLLLSLIMVATLLFQWNTSKTLAFTDPSTMTDANFFGVWNSGTSTWTTPSKINYAFSTDLSSVETYVKQGNYASAKSALLTYYRNRTTRHVQPFAFLRDTNKANLLIDDIFTSGGETYQSVFTVGNTYQTVQSDVLIGVQKVMAGGKKLSLLLMGRQKTSSAASFYSREQSTNQPVLEVTVGGNVVTLPAVKDLYIQPGTSTADTNFGGSTQLIVKDSGAPFDSLTRRTYIQFDLSSLTGTPTSAVLKMYGNNASGTGNMNISVYQADDTVWDENVKTWNNTYGNTFSWQGISGSLDWNQPSSGVEAQWINIFSRFTFAGVLTSEYTATGNEIYASNLIRLMLDFITDKGNTTPGYKSRICAGIRSVNWIKSYDMLVDSTSMDAEANTGILKYFWQMGNYLQDPANFDTDLNFGTLQAKGLYYISVYFPELVSSSSWKTTALSRFDTLMGSLINPDGSYIEDNSQYDDVTARSFADVKDFGILNGETFGSVFDDGLKSLGIYLMNTSFLNGMNIQYGDADYIDRRATVLTIGNLYNDPKMQYFGSAGASGTDPAYKYNYYPDHKLVTMRSGWDSNSLFMHINNSSGVHEHSDLLSVIAYGYGRPLIIDPGRYNYSTTDPITQWLRDHTEAQSTIEINDTAQTTGNTKSVDYWKSNNAFSFFEGTHAGYTNFSHHRSVLFVRPAYWIVSDYISTTTSGTNKFQQSWHLLPDANPTLDATTKRVKTNFSSGGNIQIVPADPTTITAALPDGYYSPAYQSVQTAKYVDYVKNVSGNVTFDTILFPTAESDVSKNVTVARLSTGVGSTIATALKINRNDGNNGNVGYYYLSHESSPSTARSFDIYNFNGKTAYVETNSTGSILNQVTIVAGKTLKQSGTNLVNSPTTIDSIGIDWNGTSVDINSESVATDTNLGTAIAIYAPTSTTVTLNGTSIPYTRSGNYIYAVKAN